MNRIVPRPTETIARETLFGPDLNSGLALRLFDLCQSNDPKAWQEAENTLLEMQHVVEIALHELERRRMVTPLDQTLCPLSAALAIVRPA